MKSLGPTQLAILRKAAGGKNIECAPGGEYLAALKLSDLRLLDRDLRAVHAVGVGHERLAEEDAVHVRHELELEEVAVEVAGHAGVVEPHAAVGLAQAPA